MGEVFLYLTGFLLLIAVLAAVLLYFGKRSTKKHESEAMAARAESVVDLYGKYLLGDDFIWAVWQGRADFAEKTILVRDEKNQEVSVIHCPNFPVGTSEIRWFEFEGKRYAQHKTSNFSVRMEYRELGSPTAIYSSKHSFNKIFIYHRNTDQLMVTMIFGSVFSKYHRILRGNVEIGRIISSEKIDAYSRVITCLPGHLSKLEQIILLAAI